LSNQTLWLGQKPQFQVPASVIRINHDHVTEHTQFKGIYWLQKPKILT